MKRLGYYTFLVFYTLFIRLTPFWFLYRLSDLCYYVMFYLVRYRRNVVQSNLQRVFPEKDAQWIKATEKKFFKHLCDISLETLKLRHMSGKSYAKRCTYENMELIHDAYKRGQGATCMIGHYGNWEYSLGITTVVKHTSLGIYKPLKNKLFDQFFFESRSHFGGIPVSMKHAFIEILKRRKKGELVLTGYAADQGPGNVAGRDWYEFMGQPTAFFKGAEKMSKKINDSVYYLKMEKVKRGHYNFKVMELFRDAANTEEGEVMKTYLQTLEAHIKEEPAYWLWSHRRWKRQMPEGTELKSIY